MDESDAVAFSALVLEGCNTDEGRHLFSSELAEFGQECQQGMGEHRAYTFHGTQDLVFGLQLGVGGDAFGDALVEQLDVGLERFGSAGIQSLEDFILSMPGLVLHDRHLLDELGAGGDQFGQSFEALVAHQRTGWHGCHEQSDDCGIDPVVFGKLAGGLGKLAHAVRVNQPERVFSFQQETCDRTFAPAAGLDRDDLGLDRGEAAVEFSPALLVVGDGEGDVERVDMEDRKSVV